MMSIDASPDERAACAAANRVMLSACSFIQYERAGGGLLKEYISISLLVASYCWRARKCSLFQYMVRPREVVLMPNTASAFASSDKCSGASFARWVILNPVR